MTVIRWAGFAGENRALHPKFLRDVVGVVSRNQKPGRGDLRPWAQPATVATVPAGRNTIYRMGRDVLSETEYWLSWTGRVHAMRGFEATDTSERTYYTGDGEPKVTDNIMALSAAPYPTTSRPLGIPAPATPPTIVAGAGAEDPVTHFYVYTYVNDWGWEGPPSPPSLAHERPADAEATISAFADPPAGNYQINRIRIYRTQTGSSGATEFFFLREIALGTASTTDDNRDLGEILPTTDWSPPPSDLSRLTPMWNGMAAGISGKSVRMSEPYVTYAWPSAYDVIPPDATPVALGVFGQALLVLTTGRPLLVTGSGPGSMDQQPIEFAQACVAPDSVASMGSGVVWASSDGLCWFGAGGPRILTAGLLTREDWQAMSPESVVGQSYEGLYIGSYDDGTGRKAFMIDPANPTGLFFLDAGYGTMHFDRLQDQLYVLSGTNVQRWDAGPGLMTARARSKQWYMLAPESFGAAMVVADSYPVILRVLCPGMSAGTVSRLVAANTRLIAPDANTVQYSVTVNDAEPVALPSGWLTETWQLEVQGQTAVQSVVMAGSIDELRTAMQ